MLSPALRLLSACLCFLTAAHAGEPLRGFIPVTVSEGPLVCLFQEGAQTDVMYLCDPAVSIKPIPAWRGIAPPNMLLIERLTKDLTLVRFGNDCYLWDMAKGTATLLWPGGDETEFLKYEGGKVLFLRRLLPDQDGRSLKSGKDGKTVADNSDRQRDKLCTFTPGDKAGAVELPAPVIETIAGAGPDGILAVTADEPRKLCFIAEDGKATDIIPFDPHWVASEIDADFSPSRDYLAFSILHDEQDFHKERDLVVVDMKRKAVCHVSRNVPVGIYYGYPQPLMRKWLDDTHLMFGGILDKAQTLDVPAGKLSAAAWPAFQKPEQKKVGQFDSSFGTTSYSMPVYLRHNPARDGVRTYSSDGKWAAFCEARSNNNTTIVDIANQQEHKLNIGLSYRIEWLAAVAAKK